MTAKCLVPVVLLSLIAQPICRCFAEGSVDGGYEDFDRLVKDGKKAEALERGDGLFTALVAEKPGHAALVLIAGRLDVARQISTLIAGGISSSQAKFLEGIADTDGLGLPSPTPKDRDASAPLLPPAQQLYWTHLRIFTGELVYEGLSAQETTFLGLYYGLRMQDSIMKIGRQVTMADPNASTNACYAMVLPLFYLQARDNAWDQVESLLALFSPEQIDVLSKLCLISVERPSAAMALARYKVKMTGQVFSMRLWASSAADTCLADHRPDLAEKILIMAAEVLSDPDRIAELRLKIAEGYARCGDYDTATLKCRQIVSDLPDAALYGKIMATYFGYLAREAKAEQIVTEMEPVLENPKCKPYLAQMFYLKWWALRKTNRQAQADEVGKRLIEQHGTNPCVAPVLLSVATDALSRQEYERCRELLTRLAKDFQGTESAKRAEDMLVRLKGK